MTPAPVTFTPIVVSLLHKDPLLRMGVLATLRTDPRLELRVVQPVDDTRWPGPLDSLLAGTDVVVADYESGLAIAAYGRASRKMPKIMVVTQRDGEAEISQALVDGVLGYVLIGCRLEEIVEGVFAVLRGQRHLGHQAAQRVAENFMHQALTEREADVLAYVAAGWSNKMVANELDIALGTVKSHVKGILDKLGAKSRTQAAAVALRRGLVCSDAVSALSGGIGAPSSRTAAGSRPLGPLC